MDNSQQQPPRPPDIDMACLEREVAQQLGSMDALKTLAELESKRVALSGRKGRLTAALKAVGTLPAEQRKAYGAAVNQMKQNLLQAFTQRRRELEQEARAHHRLAKESIDVSLPGRNGQRGGIHPVTRVLDQIITIFACLGYPFVEGPEIEDDWHNFEALNFPPHHPARAMHDTFYVRNNNARGQLPHDNQQLLRTHTSPVQVRAMADQKPPMRMLSAGKVYRSDSDYTHAPMFHQVEGLRVDETASFAELKGTLTQFIQAFFGDDFEMRFRPSYFPFTEPSAEVDISPKQESPKEERKYWLEVLGCGMVHPNVLKKLGIDPERYTGFAFGLGVERLAMLRHGVVDLRAFLKNDLRFLQQFA